jgi:hypothetical protein
MALPLDSWSSPLLKVEPAAEVRERWPVSRNVRIVVDRNGVEESVAHGEMGPSPSPQFHSMSLSTDAWSQRIGELSGRYTLAAALSGMTAYAQEVPASWQMAESARPVEEEFRAASSRPAASGRAERPGVLVPGRGLSLDVLR